MNSPAETRACGGFPSRGLYFLMIESGEALDFPRIELETLTRLASRG